MSKFLSNTVKDLRARFQARHYKPGSMTDVSVRGIGKFTLALHSKADIWLSDPIRRGEGYGQDITELLQASLSTGDLFFDIGANLGWFTVIGSRLVGPSGKVLAFEPDPFNYNLLRRNVVKNGCRNTTTFNIALGAAASTLRLARSSDNQGDHQLSRVDDRDDTVAVKVDRADRFIGNCDRPISFMKIDTQGSEAAILTGMAQILRQNPPKVLVLEFWPHGLERCGASVDELLNRLAPLAMQTWLLRQNGSVEQIELSDVVRLAAVEYAPATENWADLVLVQPNTKAIEWLNSRRP